MESVGGRVKRPSQSWRVLRSRLCLCWGFMGVNDFNPGSLAAGQRWHPV